MANNLITKARRSELSKFEFGTCKECKDTIIWGQHKTLVMVPFDPQPTHGTEMDRGYARHFCAKKEED